MSDWTTIIAFLAASAGHAIVVIYSHNWWYGSGLGRRTIDAIQLAHVPLMLAGPAAFWWLLRPDNASWAALSITLANLVIAGYGVCCWLVALHFVGLTVWRRVRPKAAALESNHTRTLDIAKELGYKPLGRGKYRHLARLPGNEVFQLDL